MTQEPVRRRLEQPSEEARKRSGCLVWGAVLGVLAGLMVGIYALPPILKHYYGETEVAADEFYRGDGKAIRVAEVGRASDPLGEPSAGMRREDIFVAILVVSEDEWRPNVTDFSLELKEVDDWEQAAEATTNGAPGIAVAAGVETRVELHFIIEVPRDTVENVTPEALHLSDPRVRWAIE